jgi:hypothetical protein
MIREILILIFMSILLAGCMTGQSQEMGTIQLTSLPSGAQIYLDNQFRGNTPGTITGIEPGNHTVEFRSVGYKNWKANIVVLSGSSNYFADMTAQPDSPSSAESSVTDTAAIPTLMTITVSKEQMIVKDSNVFSGTATGTGSVSLTLYGPGYYANGILLSQVKPNAASMWTYTWNPGSRIQSGTYTIIAEDTEKTVSERAAFTVTGDGVVTVTPNSYAVSNGDTIIFSGRCTTGAPNVRIRLLGPGRFSSGVDLGTISVTADQTWKFRSTIDSTMPTGIYTVYVSDIPETTSGSSQFTIGYAS